MNECSLHEYFNDFDKYKQHVDDKIRLLTNDLKFWGRINYNDVVNWLNQFKQEPLLGLLLIDSLNIINGEQLNASITSYFQDIKSSIYIKNIDQTDENLSRIWKEMIRKTSFIAACSDDDKASSAPTVVKEIRNVLADRLNNNCKMNEVRKEDLCSNVLKGLIERVIIVDDFIGTGKQMDSFLSRDFICSNPKCGKPDNTHCTIGKLANHNKDIVFSIYTVVLHQKGKAKLSGNYHRFEINTSNFLDSRYDLLSQECELYPRKDYKKKFVEALAELRNSIMLKNDYRQNLALAFDDSFPNNAFELYWYNETGKWHGIKK